MSYHPEEFIGKKIQVSNSKNKTLVGVTGKVIDETKKTFKIITDDSKEKIILKDECTFTINNSVIDGKNISSRPEERIKHRR